MSSNNNNRFQSVKRDRNLNSLQTTKRDKIPRFRNIDAVGGLGGEPGQEGEIILNRADNTFYGHDGYNWVPLNNVPVSLRGVGGHRHCATNLVVDGCGPDLKIRNLCAGKDINLDTCHGCVTITNTATSGDDVTLQGRGKGDSLVLDGKGPDLAIRNLIAGEGLSAKFDGDSFVLTNENPTPQPPTTLDNACSKGTSLVANGTGPNLIIKGLVKGEGIDFSENDGCVTISNTNPTPSPTTTLSDVGGCDHSVGLTAGDGVGPNLKIGRLNPGCGIDLCKEDDGSVTIVNCDPGSDVTLCGADCCSDEDSINLVLEGCGPDLAIRNLKTDGEGISLDTEDGCVTFTNTAPHVPTHLVGAGCSPEDSASLVIDGDSNPLVIRNLRGVGKGIKVEEVGGCVEISNTNTLKGKGGCHHAVDLVLKGDKPEFEIRNLNAGRGIELDTYDGCVTITNTKDCDQVTLCGKGCCPCESVNLVLDGCGPNLAIRNLTAGDGIDLDTDCDGCLVISSNCPPTTLTGLACSPEESPAGSVDLVVDGTGPELVIRNLNAGRGITLDTDAGCVTINSDPSGEVTLSSVDCSPVDPEAKDLVIDGVGPDLLLRKVVAGKGIELSTDTGCLEISATPDISVTLASQECSPADFPDTSVDLVLEGTGPNLVIRKLEAGDNVTFDTENSCVRINAISEPQAVTLSGSGCSPEGSPGSVDLVLDGVGPDLVIRNLNAGKGIILDTDAGCVNISSFDAQVSLNSAECSPINPNAVDLVLDGVGPEFVIRQLVAGEGIELNDNSLCVEISATPVTLSSQDCSPPDNSVDLVVDGNGPDLVIRKLKGAVELDGDCVNILGGGTNEDDGVFATDNAGNPITDNAAAGITAGNLAVVGGFNATASGQNSVALGVNSIASTNDSISIGRGAGAVSTSPGSLTIGLNTNVGNGSFNGVSLGVNATVGDNAVNAMALGLAAQVNDNATNAMALGVAAQVSNKAANAMAIGHLAQAPFANTIVLNATGAVLPSQQTDAFYVKPIRNANGPQMLCYDDVSGEVTYQPKAVAGAKAFGELTSEGASPPLVLTPPLFTPTVVSGLQPGELNNFTQNGDGLEVNVTGVYSVAYTVNLASNDQGVPNDMSTWLSADDAELTKTRVDIRNENIKVIFSYTGLLSLTAGQIIKLVLETFDASNYNVLNINVSLVQIS